MVAAGAQFPLLAGRQAGAGLDVDDLDFDIGQGAADGGDPQLDGIVGAGLGDHRRRFGLAVGDGDLGSVHVADDPLHDLGRAG